MDRLPCPSPPPTLPRRALLVSFSPAEFDYGKTLICFLVDSYTTFLIRHRPGPEMLSRTGPATGSHGLKVSCATVPVCQRKPRG